MGIFDVFKSKEEEKEKKKQGFALLSKERVRNIGRQGGLAASRNGKAHRWTKEDAQKAGRKGGEATRDRKREREENA